MPRNWATEIALASGATALGIAGGVIGGVVSGALSHLLGNSAPGRFLLGGVGGAIAKTITAPFERIKLMMQFEEDELLGEDEPIEGALDCARRIHAREGWRGFFRGNLANCVRYFPTQAFNFAFKEKIKKMFPKVAPGENYLKFFAVNMLAGGVAGMGSLCVVYPLDLARQSVQLVKNADGSPKYESISACLADIVNGPDGPLGLYAGLAVSIAGIIPFRVTYFMVHDTLVAMNPYQKNKDLKGLASKFLVAQLAALSAATASYPLDTVRRRLQADQTKPASQRRYAGTRDCFIKIVRDEGVGALFKGAGYNAIRTVCSAFTKVVAGKVKEEMKRRREKASHEAYMASRGYSELRAEQEVTTKEFK